MLLGNGDATFGAAMTLQAGVEPEAIGIADMNGDGLADLVVTKVCFEHQCGSIPIVLNALNENWNSCANQNKEADHTTLPIGRNA